MINFGKFYEKGKLRVCLSSNVVGDVTNCRVLSLGPGKSGWTERKLLEQGASVVSGDLDHGNLLSLVALGAIGVRLDATALPFASDSFELVTLFDVLEHIPNDKGALREIHRILKPGGRLAISVPNDSRIQCFNPIKYVQHERHYKPTQIEQLLNETGFSIDYMFVGGHFWMLFWLYVHFAVYVLSRRLYYPDWLAEKIDREFQHSDDRNMDVAISAKAFK